MTQMVRKQIYLPKRQEALLKRVAKLRGVSEAEVIRSALDDVLRGGGTRPLQPDPEAWARARRVMLSLQAQGPLPDRRRSWTRDELYEERPSRYGKHSD
jgi:hypothetical protein